LLERTTFNDWFVDGRHRTPLESAHTMELSIADKLCERCHQQNDKVMLCNGVRLTYDALASNTYNRPIASQRPCSKLLAIRAYKQKEKLLESSGVPMQYVKQRLADVTPLPDAQSLIPLNALDVYSHNVMQKIWDIIIAGCLTGITAKNILVPAMIERYPRWNTVLTELGQSTAILALTRYDKGKAPVWIADYLLQLVELREYSGLCTMLITDENPKARSKGEGDLYERARHWQSIDQLL